MATPLQNAGSSVLIIDRDESIRHMIATLLRRAGFTVHCVAEGDAAASLEQRVDVIVRDLSFAARDRELALQELERVAPEVLQRTVIMTTSRGAALKRIALARPFAVVRKPFDIDVLLDAVHRCCDDSRRHRGSVKLNVTRLEQFVRNVPRLRVLLRHEPGSVSELLLRNELRRTALELAQVLDQAAQSERNRRRAAVLLGAALVAAQLAAPVQLAEREH